MKKITAEEYREAHKKYLANLSPEEREELERKKQEAEIELRKWREDLFKQNKKLFKWLDDGTKVNAHHEKAVGILKKSIQSAADNPAMTPEVRKVAELFILLIEERNLFSYEFEDFLVPVIETVGKDTKSKSGRHAAIIRHAKNEKTKKAREKEIQGIWAKGSFSTRDLCAEEEYLALGFSSFSSARKALRKTPDPSPWPAKNK
jgi:hypothetical protein